VNTKQQSRLKYSQSLMSISLPSWHCRSATEAPQCDTPTLGSSPRRGLGWASARAAPGRVPADPRRYPVGAASVRQWAWSESTGSPPRPLQKRSWEHSASQTGFRLLFTGRLCLRLGRSCSSSRKKTRKRHLLLFECSLSAGARWTRSYSGRMAEAVSESRIEKSGSTSRRPELLSRSFDQQIRPGWA
jgi:hypothetical protein